MILSIATLLCSVFLAYSNWDNPAAFWGWACAASYAVSVLLYDKHIKLLEKQLAELED